MGLCASSTSAAAPPSLHLRFPAASAGSRKFGPYAGPDASGGYRLDVDDATGGLLPASFSSQAELRAWLLDHVTITHRSNATIVRGAGSLRGAQCIVADCKGGNIVLLDHTSTVSVDRCRDCRILIGPCDASVFLRDCADCTIAVAARQLRTRGCKDIALRLFCGTAPVIEKTKRLRIGCWRGGWFELERQLETCALSPFQNRWTEVHDFTPAAGGGQNWSWLDTSAASNEDEEGFKVFDQFVPGGMTGDAVPLTKSPRGASPEDCIMLFDATPGGYERGAAAARALAKKEQLGGCKPQTMTPAAWDALRKACLLTEDQATLTKALARNCVFRNLTPGLPPPHPQVMVLRVSRDQHGVDAEKMEYSAVCREGAAAWFEQWDIAV